MAENLQGKDTLITGADRGIGRAIALSFAAAGAQVAVNYKTNVKAANEVCQAITDGGGKAFAIQADVSVYQECMRLV